MKKILTAFMLLVCCGMVYSQDKLILLMENENKLSSQIWFYSGKGKALNQEEIKKNWNEERHITAAAYTATGWFVSMAKNSGFGWQSYHYDSSWPTEWILENSKKKRYITSLCCDASKWFIVLSAGTGYTDQINLCGSWDKVGADIAKYWNEEYRITCVARYASGWDVVMSKNSNISRQAYKFARSDNELVHETQQMWADGLNIQLIEFGEGKYLIVGCTYKDSKTPRQSYKVFFDNPSDFISQGWNDGKNIAYAGGGSTQDVPVAGQQIAQNSSNVVRTDKYTEVTIPYMGGTMRMQIYPDGSGWSVINTPCRLCYGAGQCSVCHGRGSYWHAYYKSYQPCPSCLGSKRCKYCKGTGKRTLSKHYAPGEAEAILESYRAMKSEKQNGTSTRQRRNSSAEYIDEIYYVPNYTGKPYADEWCSKCEKWMQPHKHLRKRL